MRNVTDFQDRDHAEKDPRVLFFALKNAEEIQKMTRLCGAGQGLTINM